MNQARFLPEFIGVRALYDRKNNKWNPCVCQLNKRVIFRFYPEKGSWVIEAEGDRYYQVDQDEEHLLVNYIENKKRKPNQKHQQTIKINGFRV